MPRRHNPEIPEHAFDPALPMDAVERSFVAIALLGFAGLIATVIWMWLS